MTRRIGAARGRWLLALALLVSGGALRADDEYQKIIYWRVGDAAPPIELKDDQSNDWKLSKHCAKKYVVVYFYLGDFMPGCTRQAIAYRDHYAAIVAQGAEVVGVSGDKPANHQLFKEVYQLKQTLLADDKGDVGKAYGLAWSGGGTWEIKDAKGKPISLPRGITESRWTWIIGKDGTVIYKDANATPEDDCKQVLKFLTELNAQQQP